MIPNSNSIFLSRGDIQCFIVVSLKIFEGLPYILFLNKGLRLNNNKLEGRCCLFSPSLLNSVKIIDNLLIKSRIVPIV